MTKNEDLKASTTDGDAVTPEMTGDDCEEYNKPVDTIAVPREVLQGLREALLNCVTVLERTTDETLVQDAINCGNKALASLDAVLSEGE